MRWRDEWIPWLFVAGFVVTIGANGTLIHYATATFTGLTTEDHYEKGLRYNETLAAVARQEALGWQIDLGTERLGGAGVAVGLTLRDRAGAPLTGAEVETRFIRPTHEGMDFKTALTESGAGRYEAEIELPLKGQWDIRLSIRHPQGTHQLTQRTFIR